MVYRQYTRADEDQMYVRQQVAPGGADSFLARLFCCGSGAGAVQADRSVRRSGLSANDQREVLRSYSSAASLKPVRSALKKSGSDAPSSATWEDDGTPHQPRRGVPSKSGLRYNEDEEAFFTQRNSPRHNDNCCETARFEGVGGLPQRHSPPGLGSYVYDDDGEDEESHIPPPAQQQHKSPKVQQVAGVAPRCGGMDSPTASARFSPSRVPSATRTARAARDSDDEEEEDDGGHLQRDSRQSKKSLSGPLTVSFASRQPSLARPASSHGAPPPHDSRPQSAVLPAVHVDQRDSGMEGHAQPVTTTIRPLDRPLPTFNSVPARELLPPANVAVAPIAAFSFYSDDVTPRDAAYGGGDSAAFVAPPSASQVRPITPAATPPSSPTSSITPPALPPPPPAGGRLQNVNSASAIVSGRGERIKLLLGSSAHSQRELSISSSLTRGSGSPTGLSARRLHLLNFNDVALAGRHRGAFAAEADAADGTAAAADWQPCSPHAVVSEEDEAADRPSHGRGFGRDGGRDGCVRMRLSESPVAADSSANVASSQADRLRLAAHSPRFLSSSQVVTGYDVFFEIDERSGNLLGGPNLEAEGSILRVQQGRQRMLAARPQRNSLTATAPAAAAAAVTWSGGGSGGTELDGAASWRDDAAAAAMAEEEEWDAYNAGRCTAGNMGPLHQDRHTSPLVRVSRITVPAAIDRHSPPQLHQQQQQQRDVQQHFPPFQQQPQQQQPLRSGATNEIYAVPPPPTGDGPKAVGALYGARGLEPGGPAAPARVAAEALLHLSRPVSRQQHGGTSSTEGPAARREQQYGGTSCDVASRGLNESQVGVRI